MTKNNLRYKIFKNAFPKEKCSKLVSLLEELRNENYLVHFDNQCPISYSFYGVLDDLLPYFGNKFSNYLNIDLLPTYSYTRIYRVGETLKEHTDRPSCQYSATLCLGMSDEKTNWPIYMDNKKLILNVGDLCLYKGTDVSHYRPRCEIEWMAQTFLHYVDANGEYKDCKYDGRPGLNTMLKEKNDRIEHISS